MVECPSGSAIAATSEVTKAFDTFMCLLECRVIHLSNIKHDFLALIPLDEDSNRSVPPGIVVYIF